MDPTSEQAKSVAGGAARYPRLSGLARYAQIRVVFEDGAACTRARLRPAEDVESQDGASYEGRNKG